MRILAKILPWIIIAVLAFFLIRGCHKPEWREQPKVEPVKEQKQKVHEIIIEDKKGKDSAIALFKKEQKNTESLSGLLIEIQKENNTLAEKVREQAEKDCPNLTPQLDKLSAQKAKSDANNAKIAASLRNQIAIKSKMADDCEKTKAKLLSRLDTSFQNQTALKKSNDKLKPRVQFVLSAEAFGNAGKILNGYGAGVGLRFKNGTTFIVKVWQLDKATNYGGQIIIPVSFRK